MSAPLLGHPYWPLVRPWVVVETYDRDGGHTHPRHRFEMRLPKNADFRAVLVAMTCPCCACGDLIHPLRGRKGESAEDRRLYIAVACELAKNYGCARGQAARDAYEALLAALLPVAVVPPFTLV